MRMRLAGKNVHRWQKCSPTSAKNGRLLIATFVRRMQGNHVLLREFEFINMTPRNRLAFVRLVVESHRNTPPGMYATSICLPDSLSLQGRGGGREEGRGVQKEGREKEGKEGGRP